MSSEQARKVVQSRQLCPARPDPDKAPGGVDSMRLRYSSNVSTISSRGLGSRSAIPGATSWCRQPSLQLGGIQPLTGGAMRAPPVDVLRGENGTIGAQLQRSLAGLQVAVKQAPHGCNRLRRREAAPVVPGGVQAAQTESGPLSLSVQGNGREPESRSHLQPLA